MFLSVLTWLALVCVSWFAFRNDVWASIVFIFAWLFLYDPLIVRRLKMIDGSFYSLSIWGLQKINFNTIAIAKLLPGESILIKYRNTVIKSRTLQVGLFDDSNAIAEFLEAYRKKKHERFHRLEKNIEPKIS